MSTSHATPAHRECGAQGRDEHQQQRQEQVKREGQTQQQHDQPQGQRAHTASGERAVLSHGRSSLVSDIRNVVTTKHNQLFLLTDQAGDILESKQGHGLYFRDTCFLEQLEMCIAGDHAIPLLADASAGSEAHFELTNGDIAQGADSGGADRDTANRQQDDPGDRDEDGGWTLPKERLSIRRRYTLHHDVTHEIRIHHLGSRPASLDLTLALASHFTNMFVVRGAEPGKRGTLHTPQARGNTLLFAYDGADGHRRTTRITFSPPPDALDERSACFALHLNPGDQHSITATIQVEDQAPREVGNQHSEQHERQQKTATAASQTPRSSSTEHAAFDKALADLPRISTSNPLFDLALNRSLADIRMLATANAGEVYIAAGVPWYVALFGRDSCISAFELLAFQPAVAKSTLAVLARYQGTEEDDYRDERPGKILHELRVGEKANLHEVPQYPYYGTVDATPWFLLLLSE